jgi:hypothetical protein
MHSGSPGSGLPPGFDALAPAVGVAVGTLAVAVVTAGGDALCSAVGMLAVVVVGAAVVPVGSARWHAGKTARARRYRARRRTSS